MHSIIYAPFGNIKLYTLKKQTQFSISNLKNKLSFLYQKVYNQNDAHRASCVQVPYDSSQPTMKHNALSFRRLHKISSFCALRNIKVGFKRNNIIKFPTLATSLISLRAFPKTSINSLASTFTTINQ